MNTSDYNGFGVSCNGASDGFIDITAEGGVGDFYLIGQLFFLMGQLEGQQVKILMKVISMLVLELIL